MAFSVPRIKATDPAGVRWHRFVSNLAVITNQTGQDNLYSRIQSRRLEVVGQILSTISHGIHAWICHMKSSS